MPRQRSHALLAAWADRRQAVEVQFRDEDAVLTWRARAFGRRRHDLAEDPTVCRRATIDALPGEKIRLVGCRRERSIRARRTAARRPLDVEEVDSRPAPDQWRRHRARSTRAPPRASPAGGETRADFEQPDVAPAVTAVVRDRIDEPRQERRPERVELGRQRVRDVDDRSHRRSARRPAPPFSMKPNVTASDRPAAVSTRRTSWSRGTRGSGGGAGAVTAGKRRSSLSNP